MRLDGESLVEYLPEERSSLGIVRSFQDCRLFPELTVEEVLLLTLDAPRPVGVVVLDPAGPWARRSERDKRAAVDEVVGSFGIDRFRRHQIAQLSTGTRRVVDLASIVLARPRLLLLDEPTAGIAQREAEAFVPLLRRLHQLADTTIVLVEHDVPLVFALCTQVVMMETGRGGVVGHPRRGGARTPGPWPPTWGPAPRPWPCPGHRCPGPGDRPRFPRRADGPSALTGPSGPSGPTHPRPLHRSADRPVGAVHPPAHVDPVGTGCGGFSAAGMAGPKGTSPRRVTRWAMRTASP